MQIALRKRHKKRLQPINRGEKSRWSNGDRLLPKPNHCRKKSTHWEPSATIFFLCVNHIWEIKINVNIFAVLYFAPLNHKTVLNLTLLGAGWNVFICNSAHTQSWNSYVRNELQAAHLSARERERPKEVITFFYLNGIDSSWFLTVL